MTNNITEAKFRNDPKPELLKTLNTLIDLANEGKIISIIASCETLDHSVLTISSPMFNVFAAIGGIEQLKKDLLE